jgi:hypothetical protein
MQRVGAERFQACPAETGTTGVSGLTSEDGRRREIRTPDPLGVNETIETQTIEINGFF